MSPTTEAQDVVIAPPRISPMAYAMILRTITHQGSLVLMPAASFFAGSCRMSSICFCVSLTFIGKYAFVFGCKDTAKKKRCAELRIAFSASGYKSMYVSRIIYYIVVEVFDFVGEVFVSFDMELHEFDVALYCADSDVVGLGYLLVLKAEVLVECVGYNPAVVNGDVDWVEVFFTPILTDFDKYDVGGRTVPPPFFLLNIQ